MACGYPERFLGAMKAGVPREEMEICVKRIFELTLRFD